MSKTGPKINEQVHAKVDDLISVFNVKDCYIKNVVLLKEKIKKFVEGGASTVQIISDFDRTLTKHFVDDHTADVSYCVVRNSKQLPESIVKELDALQEKYLPIEMCMSMNMEEKIPLMVEWWSTSLNLGIKAGINKNIIPEMVRQSTVCLRDGVTQLFHIVEEKNIPFLLVSAGLGDIIQEVLHQQTKVSSQLQILANFYTYDSDGMVNGRKGELIHSFNKNLISKLNKTYFKSMNSRTNAIIFGDTLGDPHMADGIEHLHNVLKIGFLNHDIETSLKGYLSVYDVVLTHDADMNTINAFLQILLKG